MNVLFLSSDFVLPAERGLRVRTLSQLRVLHAIDAVTKITLLSLSETPVPGELLRSLEERLPKVRAIPAVLHRSSLRGHPLGFLRFLQLRIQRGEPYLIAKLDSPEMRALLARHMGTETFDVVYLGYIGMAAYLGDVRRLAPRASVVLEQHNVEWKIFDRLADTFRPPFRQAARLEAHALRRFERQSLRGVDSVIAISDADAAGLRELAGVDAVVVPPFISPNPPRSETAHGPRLGYIGHLGWQPNVLGLDWFCQSVWPLVRKLVPDALLTIAGPGLHKRPDGTLEVPVTWSQPGITTVGFVDDLEDVYRDTVAMVAPVVGGSGVRMKLLETMSAGMPTVTTTDGAAGLGIVHEGEVLIADAPQLFADGVARVLADAALRERLRQGGYAFLRARHSEQSAQVRLERSLAAARVRADERDARSPRGWRAIPRPRRRGPSGIGGSS